MASRHDPVVTTQPTSINGAAILENRANELVEETSKDNNNKNDAFNFTQDTDPFRVRLNFSTLDWIKMAIMAVTIVPIRIVALFITVVFCWLIALIGLTGMDRSSPLTGWRLVLRKVVAAGGRTCCRCVGFHTVKITGKQVGKEVAPVLVAAPHSSFFDGLALFFSGLPFLVSRVENLQIPFIGKLSSSRRPFAWTGTTQTPATTRSRKSSAESPRTNPGLSSSSSPKEPPPTERRS